MQTSRTKTAHFLKAKPSSYEMLNSEKVAQLSKSRHVWKHLEVAYRVAKNKETLKTVFDQAAKIINFIKAKELNNRIFKELCMEMGEKHGVLLHHTEVRWLSRGRVIIRLIELHKAVQAFLLEKKAGLAECFFNQLWLSRLCYISDIFTELNKGNLALQVYNVTVIEAKEFIFSFRLSLFGVATARLLPPHPC